MGTQGTLNVLFIPYGTSLAPATRYRIYQYLDFLKAKSVHYRVYPIISERLTRRMIRAPAFNRLQKIIYYFDVVIERFIRMWKVFFMANKFDAVFLQRVTFPEGFGRILRARNKNIIFDIDDSIYMPDSEERGFIGWAKKHIKKTEVVSVLRVSKCAIVENGHIKNFVQKYCNKIYMITGPINTVKNYPRDHRADTEEITVGWIGSPSTAVYLGITDNVLKELRRRYKIKVRLIGIGSYSIEGLNVETTPWSEATEVSELHKFDIGIMPMPDNEWTRGKVGCKMLQYMANAIPAVVSYTPTNAEIIKDGVNGFLAHSEEEWIRKLSLLIEDSGLRGRIGLAGRKTVEEKFSVEVNERKFLEVLLDSVNR